MEELIQKHIEDCIRIKKQIIESSPKVIAQIAEEIIRAYQKGNKVLWFGNGGSAADAQHLSCELLGKFCIRRKVLESLALTTNVSILTAIANDYDFDEIFTRQVEASVKPGDIVIGISTSGNSRNVIRGIEEAKILIEQWRKEYNQVRPHSAKNYRPPAPEAILTMTTT